MMRFFWPRGAYCDLSAGLPELKRLPCAVAASFGSGSTRMAPPADAADDALGGTSRPPLRPHAPSANVIAVKKTTTNFEDTKPEARFTMEFPKCEATLQRSPDFGEP